MLTHIETDREFLNNSDIDIQYEHIVHAIRQVLSKWTGENPTKIFSAMKPKELKCLDWDPDEFMWELLDELKLDSVFTDKSFPSLFQSGLPFFRKKPYNTVGEWTKAVICEWFISLEVVDC